MFLFLVFLVIGTVYLLPAFVAKGRDVSASGGIVVLNLFLGWTLLGWVGALIWACSAETKQAAQLREAAYAHITRGAGY